MLQKIGNALAVILLVAAGGAGYIAVRAHLESEIYRDRLLELVEEYDRLAARHQEAIRKSAVTELRVYDGSLSILIHTAGSGFQRTRGGRPQGCRPDRPDRSGATRAETVELEVHSRPGEDPVRFLSRGWMGAIQSFGV